MPWYGGGQHTVFNLEQGWNLCVWTMTGKGLGFKGQEVRLFSSELKLYIVGRVSFVVCDEKQKINKPTNSSYSYTIK